MINEKKKTKNQHRIGTINGKNKMFQSISKGFFLLFLCCFFCFFKQTSYRTYIHLYINISVRRETEPDTLAALTS